MKPQTKRVVLNGIAIFALVTALALAIFWVLLALAVAAFYSIPFSESGVTVLWPSALYLVFGVVAALLLWKRITKIVVILFFAITAIGAFLLCTKLIFGVAFMITLLFGLAQLTALILVIFIKESFIKSKATTKSKVRRK